MTLCQLQPSLPEYVDEKGPDKVCKARFKDSQTMKESGSSTVYFLRRLRYTSCAMLVQDLLVAKRDLRLRKEIKKLARHDGLIIDEMGYVQQSREEMEVLFTLLSERYERGSVLLTSNLPFS